MKSLMSLRWFPAKSHEVDLECVENKVKYRVVVLKGYTAIGGIIGVEEEKIVAFDDVADTVWASITKWREK
jgi:hypothetical protein